MPMQISMDHVLQLQTYAMASTCTVFPLSHYATLEELPVLLASIIA